ncbi:hypothetical protein, partial [Flavobacterium branchiophilum]
MKTNYFSSKKSVIYTLFGLISVMITSCGTYQNSTYYDHDGIYGNESQKPVVRTENNSKYQDYFYNLQQESGLATTTADTYTSTPNASATTTSNTTQTATPSYSSWGSNPSTVNITYYGSGWGLGYNSWGFNTYYGWNPYYYGYSPYYGYGMYNNWHGWGWGWNYPYAYYNPYYGYGYYGNYYNNYYGSYHNNGYGYSYNHGNRRGAAGNLGGGLYGNSNYSNGGRNRTTDTYQSPRSGVRNDSYGNTVAPRGSMANPRNYLPRTDAAPRSYQPRQTSETTNQPRGYQPRTNPNTNEGTPRPTYTPRTYTPSEPSTNYNPTRADSAPRSYTPSNNGGGSYGGGGGGGRSGGGGG